jgi:ANTAR domain-containing protein
MREQAPDAAEVRLNRLVNLILEAAVEALGVSAATVTVRHGKNLSTVGATDQRLLDVDQAQYEDGGPCIATLDRPDPIFLRGVETDSDEAWEHFAETAAHLGIKSSVSMHIPTDSTDVAASLNLYSRSPLELSDAWTRHANIYAEQLEATLQSVDAYKSTATLATHLAEAISSRSVIEQAKGILMADERITDDEAFQRLSTLSQHANVKLRHVARRLVEERSRPR